VQVTRENIADAVKQALSLCDQLRAQVPDGKSDSTNEDLRIAQQALELIASEISSGKTKMRQPRSGIFTRYVVDEEPRIALDPTLKNLILKIEDVYRRM
jgi:hypothetical protein